MDVRPNIPFHAKVRVRSLHPNTQEIDGRLGYVAGITEEPQDNGRFGYAILIYDFARVWCCDEDELEPLSELDYGSIRCAEEQAKRLAQKRVSQ